MLKENQIILNDNQRKLKKLSIKFDELINLYKIKIRYHWNFRDVFHFEGGQLDLHLQKETQIEMKAEYNMLLEELDIEEVYTLLEDGEVLSVNGQQVSVEN